MKEKDQFSQQQELWVCVFPWKEIARFLSIQSGAHTRRTRWREEGQNQEQIGRKPDTSVCEIGREKTNYTLPAKNVTPTYFICDMQ